MKKYVPALVAIVAFFLLFLTKEHMTGDPEKKPTKAEKEKEAQAKKPSEVS